MIALGYVLVGLVCSPLGCEYVPLEDDIQTVESCQVDKVMTLLPQPMFDLQCATVKRDADSERYNRPPFTPAENDPVDQ